MTNEDQKTQNEEMNEDNLMNELDEFNSGSSPDVEQEQLAEEQQVENSTEEVQENQSVEKVDKEEPESESKVEQWLIENKFANDEEGKQALADAYKQLQSKSDKEKKEWSGCSPKTDRVSTGKTKGFECSAS